MRISTNASSTQRIGRHEVLAIALVGARVYRSNMTPLEIKALRTALGCSTRDLAEAIGEQQDTVLSWERGDSFPTKRAVDRMKALEAAGPSAMPRKSRVKASRPLSGLADPEVWAILRKVLAHPELRKRVSEMSKSYDDPNDES